MLGDFCMVGQLHHGVQRVFRRRRSNRTPFHVRGARYRRLTISLAEEIQTGRYGSETTLPTDSELMLKYGLGRQTVRRAFQELVTDGLVYRVRGKGTFPTTRPKSGSRTVRSTGSIEALEQWSGTEMEVISPLELRRDLEYAQRLELDEPVVARLTVRRWIDDEPFAVTEIIVPPDVGGRLVSEDKIPTGRLAGTILARSPAPMRR